MPRGGRRRLRRHPALPVIALQINGKQVQLEGPTTLLAYLETLGVSPRAVAVEHNGVIVERDAYAATTLSDGDVVEIVRMVGGGRRRALS
jgi:thiamine biosynthesis protein ThiS